MPNRPALWLVDPANEFCDGGSLRCRGRWYGLVELPVERRFHLFLPLVLAVSGLVVSTIVGPPTLKLTCLCVAAFGIFAAIPIFWTLPRAIVPASALTTGIATVNSIGGLSGFVDSYAVGLIKDLTGEFAGGLWFIAGFGAISIMLLAAVTRDTAWARKGGGLVVGVKARGFSTSLRRVALRWSQSRKSFQTRASGKEQNP
jgi:hypothetical protein